MTQDYLHRLGLLLFASPWSSNWPFVCLPLIAWTIGRKAVPLLDRMSSDPLWQQRMSVHLSCLPGLVMISLGVSAVLALHTAEIDSLLCFVVFVVPVLIFLFALSKATVLLLRRRRALNVLRDQTIPASHRLQSIATVLGINVRELPGNGFACMVAGMFRPVVIISTAAVESLTDKELHIILLHERAHLIRRDTLWATLVTSLADCGFWPTEEVLSVYRRSREIIADRLACQDTDQLLLASVLVRFARGLQHNHLNFVENFAERSSVAERVKLLVEDGSQVRPGRFRVLAGLVAVFASVLVLYPFIVRMAVVSWLHCP
jgi:beta-lactamase regulating signal transducer with metallopeptidase domain